LLNEFFEISASEIEFGDFESFAELFGGNLLLFVGEVGEERVSEYVFHGIEYLQAD
jgi:hypothetical protein